MIVNTFITIQQAEKGGWDIVQKTYPKYIQDGISVRKVHAIVTKILDYIPKKEEAQKAAESLAKTKKLLSVKAGQSVILLSPSGAGWLPQELGADNKLVEAGSYHASLQYSSLEGLNVAMDKGLLFILPQKADEDVKPAFEKEEKKQ